MVPYSWFSLCGLYFHVWIALQQLNWCYINLVINHVDFIFELAITNQLNICVAVFLISICSVVKTLSLYGIYVPLKEVIVTTKYQCMSEVGWQLVQVISSTFL